MSKAKLIEIADAVVEELNGVYGHLVQLKRYYAPEFELMEMDAAHISVIPLEVSSEAAERAKDRYDYRIQIVLQQRVALPASNDVIDSLILWLEEIDDLFRHKTLVGDAHWVKSEIEPVYSISQMQENGLFSGVITLTFRTWR